MTDPILTVLLQISQRNKDAKFVGLEKLKGDVTAKRYAGVVEAPYFQLVKRLADAGVSWSDLCCSQDTDGTGMQLTVLSQKGVEHFKYPEYKGSHIPGVLVLCLFVIYVYLTFG